MHRAQRAVPGRAAAVLVETITALHELRDVLDEVAPDEMAVADLHRAFDEGAALGRDSGPGVGGTGGASLDLDVLRGGEPGFQFGDLPLEGLDVRGIGRFRCHARQPSFF
jgi:hypothetical protein